MSERSIKDILKNLKARDPNQPEFHQAVAEALESLKTELEGDAKLFECMTALVEPERTLSFRVLWVDDKGQRRLNRGYRVQFNSAIGPYKGGLRFHPSVNLSILKFLGFEQILKNALTTLPMGGAKGGSDFNPKGKSDNEIMQFCQAFMTELFRHIGSHTDVPAGDIGVGGREIGYLFGMYKKLRNAFTGILTGKGYSYGGSLIRPEATGYGAVYFAKEHITDVLHKDFSGATAMISGSGNVAQYCCQKLTEEGASVLTMSDSSGYIYVPKGISVDNLKEIMHLKNVKRGRISVFAANNPKIATFFKDQKPWATTKCEYAFPCATQNEINKSDAIAMAKNGVIGVYEGANMPSTAEAIAVYKENKMLYGPAKAVNAGGVATSGLEMSQNSIRSSWTREEVDTKLHNIMRNIYTACKVAAKKAGKDGDLQFGANYAGFLKVASAMTAQGWI